MSLVDDWFAAIEKAADLDEALTVMEDFEASLTPEQRTQLDDEFDEIHRQSSCQCRCPDFEAMAAVEEVERMLEARR